MPQTEFKTTFSAGERQQTYALDREVTGIGMKLFTIFKISRRLLHTV